MSTQQPILSQAYFSRFADLIYQVCAIKLTPLKKTMLNSRLNRRLHVLGIKSFREYYAYVLSPQGQSHELVRLIDEVCTNKTDFFREPDHFTFLTQVALRSFAGADDRENRMFRVWSAGCSSGEEAYTLAMVLADFKKLNPWFDFAVTATDISTKVLSIADRGVYSDDRLLGLPSTCRVTYMMRGKNANKGQHKIVPELREKITFKRLNFLEGSFSSISGHPFDVIFCRNVIIYFDRQTQLTFFPKLYQHLRPGGYIVTGHSESLPGMTDRLERVASSLYRDRRKPRKTW